MLDNDLWAALTDEQKAQWTHVEAMTQTPGWQLFLQEMDSAASEAYSQVWNAKDWDEYLVAKERHRIYQMVSRFTEVLEYHLETEVHNASA